jgi:hypothetical protein
VEGGNISELARGLDRPMGVAIGPDGAVYAAEAGAGCVTKLLAGRSDTVIDGLGEPHGLAVAGGRLYTLDVGAKQLIESDLSGGARRVIASDLPVGAPPGVVAKQLGGVGDMCGPMNTFSGLTTGPNGTIYIAGDGEGSVLAIRAL